MILDRLYQLASSGPIVASAIAGIGFLLSLLITRRVQYHYDSKIEDLKRSIGRNNSRIDSIQAAAITQMSARHAALDTRRLQAIEALWSATVFERRYSVAVQILQSLNVENIQKAVEAGGKDTESLKAFGAAMASLAGLDNFTKKEFVAANERLFVPPLAWAAYDALRSINGQAIGVLLSIKSGIGPRMIKDISLVNELVLIALPKMEEFINQNPNSAVYFMANQLEDLIFEELTTALNFAESDSRAVARTSEIVHRIEAESVKLPEGIPAKYLRNTDKISSR